MKSKRRRNEPSATAFVPRIVLKTMMASLVPAIAAGSTGCVISLAVTAFDASDTTDGSNTNDAGTDATIDAGTDAIEDMPGPGDSNVIVLAQIGFEVDPAAVREQQVADNARAHRRNGAIDRASRRGRA